jgi:hypothetical protein
MSNSWSSLMTRAVFGWVNESFDSEVFPWRGFQKHPRDEVTLRPTVKVDVRCEAGFTKLW